MKRQFIGLFVIITISLIVLSGISVLAQSSRSGDKLVTDTIAEGKTKNYPNVGGINYDVKLDSVDTTSSNKDAYKATFTVNGQTTPQLTKGTKHKLSDGSIISVVNIFKLDACDIVGTDPANDIDAVTFSFIPKPTVPPRPKKLVDIKANGKDGSKKDGTVTVQAGLPVTITWTSDPSVISSSVASCRVTETIGLDEISSPTLSELSTTNELSREKTGPPGGMTINPARNAIYTAKCITDSSGTTTVDSVRVTVLDQQKLVDVKVTGGSVVTPVDGPIKVNPNIAVTISWTTLNPSEIDYCKLIKVDRTSVPTELFKPTPKNRGKQGSVPDTPNGKTTYTVKCLTTKSPATAVIDSVLVNVVE